MSAFRTLLRELTPPLIWRVTKKLHKKLLKRPAFHGVYKTYQDIPQENQWESELWIRQQKTALDTAKRQIPSYLPNMRHTHTNLTVLYLNSLSWKDKVRVLDFGGASGEVYYSMVAGGALLYPDNIDWTVVDSQNLIELGEKAKDAKDQITYLSQIPIGRQFDVLYVSTVFQYIDDIEAIAETLLKETKPRHVVLTRLFSGADNPEYFTENYAFGRRCPLHIFNTRKLAEVIEKHGFHPVLRAVNMEETISPASYKEVPLSLQIYNTSHLFFTK